MAGGPKAQRMLSAAERERLEAAVRKRSALRSRIVLNRAGGAHNHNHGRGEAAAAHAEDRMRGGNRFVRLRLDGLLDAPRPGAPSGPRTRTEMDRRRKGEPVIIMSVAHDIESHLRARAAARGSRETLAPLCFATLLIIMTDRRASRSAGLVPSANPCLVALLSRDSRSRHGRRRTAVRQSRRRRRAGCARRCRHRRARPNDVARAALCSCRRLARTWRQTAMRLPLNDPTDAEHDVVLLERQGATAIVTINRPKSSMR